MIHSYQSANLTDNEIVKHFIVRKKEFERIIAEISRDDMAGAIQHFILIGRRGSGKSTLLRRIQAEVNIEQKLNEKLIVINLSEEQAGVYRLHDLWDLVIRELNTRKIQTEVPDWSSFTDDLQGYSKSLYASIQITLQKQGKKLLLLLDNIDRIFDNIGEEAHLLRELLMNHKDLRIIGGSTRMSEHYWKYDMPFYEFFRIIRLESLKREEVGELLTYWSGCLNLPEVTHFLEKNPGKIETIRLLTDGMPRTLLNFIEILIDRSDQNGFEYLRSILDRATPVYQERLNSLPPAQRKIVSELSNFWDAVKVNQLTDVCKMSGKLVSAQLSQLVKNEMVEKIAGLKRDNLYRLAERFFNLWLLMTQGGPKEKRQVKYLTVFLENWYDEKEFQTLCGEHIVGLEGGKLSPDYAALMTSALSHSRFLTLAQRDAVIEKTRSLQEPIADYADYIPLSSKEIFADVTNKIEEGDYHGARSAIGLIEQEDELKDILIGLCYVEEKEYLLAEKYYKKAIDKGSIEALNNLAFLYHETKRLEEAEKYCLMAVEKGNHNAIYNLANLYSETNRFEEAEKYYLMAIEKGNKNALNNLAYLYHQLKRFEEAEKYYKIAIDEGDIGAIYNLANLYMDKNKFADAEKYYLNAIDKNIIEALNNLAVLYLETKRLEEAEKYFLMAIDKGNTEALNNIANLFKKTKRLAEAEKYYLFAIDKGDINALYNLANLYRETNRINEAEKYYLMAIDRGDVESMNNLANLYHETKRLEEAEKYCLMAVKKDHILAMYNLANLYSETNRYKEAEKYYLLAIDKGNNDAMHNLAYLYSVTNRKNEAEKYYLRAIVNGNINSKFNLCLMYYDMNKEKTKVIKLADELILQNEDISTKTLYVNILLWVGRMKQFETEVKKLIPNLIEKEESSYLISLFSSFLIHMQYNLAWSWFNDKVYGEKLKEILKPLYYITAEFITGLEEESLKPGPELEESISEIRKEILEKQKFYYDKKAIN